MGRLPRTAKNSQSLLIEQVVRRHGFLVSAAAILLLLAAPPAAQAQTIYNWLQIYPPATARALINDINQVAKENGLQPETLAAAVRPQSGRSQDASALVARIAKIGGQLATVEAQMAKLQERVDSISESIERDQAAQQLKEARQEFNNGDLAALGKTIETISTLRGSDQATEEAKVQAVITQANLLTVSNPADAIDYLNRAQAGTWSPTAHVKLRVSLADFELQDAVERGDRRGIEALHASAVSEIEPAAEAVADPDLTADTWLVVAHTDDALLKWSQQPGDEYRDALKKALSLVNPERDANEWAVVEYTIGAYNTSSHHYKDAIEDFELVLNQPRLDSGAWIRAESYFGEGNAYFAEAVAEPSKEESVALLTKALAAHDAAAEFYKQRTGKIPLRMAINEAGDMALIATKLDDADGLVKAAQTIEAHKDDSDRLILPSSWAHVQSIIANAYGQAGVLYCRANRITECVASLSRAKDYYDRFFSVMKRDMLPEVYDETKRNSEQVGSLLQTAMHAGQ